MFYRLRLFLAFLIMAIWSGCDDNYVSSIPSYPVGLQLNLTSTYSTFKNSTNQFLLFEKRINVNDMIGYGGILVCTGVSLDDSGNTIYYAFDMACPYEVKRDVRVYPVKDGLGQVKCEKCGSVYNIGYGSGYPEPNSGPAAGPDVKILRRYNTSLSNDDLYIYR